MPARKKAASKAQSLQGSKGKRARKTAARKPAAKKPRATSRRKPAKVANKVTKEITTKVTRTVTRRGNQRITKTVTKEIIKEPDVPLEIPSERDFAAMSARACSSYLALPHVASALQTEAESNDCDSVDDNDSGMARKPLRAPYPAIPDPRQDVAMPPRRFRKRTRRPRKEPASFTSLSTEIRDEIYRGLLLSREPIQVHANWRLVYKGANRNKLAREFHPSILRVNKRIHAEASRILYGENTFLYLLRDLPNSVTNIQALAEDDSELIVGNEGESGSEYEGEAPARSTRRRGTRRRKTDQVDINLDRYSWLFRRIAVQAEHNRYSDDTQQSMANAIRFFAQNPATDGQTHELNIHSLTIRVAPRVDLDADPVHGVYTFVNFFEPGSVVLEAIQSVECQFLFVDLLKVMPGGPRRVSTEQGCRLFVDMRHQRIWKRWSGGESANNLRTRDRATLRYVKNRCMQSMMAVQDLSSQIKQQCILQGFYFFSLDDWLADAAHLWHHGDDLDLWTDY